ncbi:MAG: helix-hairpin-helix domain-containing protein, partial [Dermatophilaceae bacterium]
LQDLLELDEAPLRIECYDVSHVQGTNVVASMVVFEDGLARKSEYRRFIVRGAAPEHAGADGAGGDGAGGDGAGADGAGGDADWDDGTVEGAGPIDPGTIDDTAAMREVLTRRFRRYLEDAESSDDLDLATGVITETPAGGTGRERSAESEPGSAVSGPIDPETGRPRRFAYPPSLVVVDGGLPQVNAAQAVLDQLGIEEVALVGLAKRLEEVWLPHTEHPLILPRTSEGLYLLQRLRDEAHRFAITFHRQRRSKSMTTSALDGIAGLGPSRQRALLRHFGSVKRLRAATADEIMTVPGIGPALAAAVVTQLAVGQPPEPAVNLTTGEVLE